MAGFEFPFRGFSVLLLGVALLGRGEKASAEIYTPDFHSKTAAASLPFPLVKEIRVLIFPHLDHLPPQGQDRRVSEIEFETLLGECRLFEGATLLRHSARGWLRARELTSSLSMSCDGPTTFLREASLASYFYEGEFEIRRGTTADGEDFVQIVNFLPLENYLKGVIPIEMPSSWPAEALMSQAVAARSYALFQIGESRILDPKAEWDVVDTVRDQAYTGLSNAVAETGAAVDQTTALILVSKSARDQVIKTYFSADAGGYTEDASHLWPQAAPWCKAREETFDRALLDPKWRPWEFPIDLKIMTEKLRASGHVALDEKLVELRLDESDRWVSGRMGQFSLVLQKMGEGLGDRYVRYVRKISGPEFRASVGLRSLKVSLQGSGENGSSLIGTGYGHGAGMSQVGAMAYSQFMGWTYDRILLFYYSDAVLSKAN